MPDKFTMIEPAYNNEIAKEIEQQTTKAMHEYLAKIERSLELQNYCYYCLKDRPELIETLRKDGWIVMQKAPVIDRTEGGYAIVTEAWWACKECQLGGYKE